MLTPQMSRCYTTASVSTDYNYTTTYSAHELEHAHLSIISETRGLLHHQLGMSNDEIADLFESWFKEGPLRGNFLIGIGYKGLRFKRGDGIKDERGIVEGIEDKVTQDVDLSEGTGTWSTMVSTKYREFKAGC